MPVQPGETLRHRYRIEKTLGQGGMGAVHRAHDVNLGVPVAVKENLFTTQDYAQQFRREARILASLRHPNLPRVTDHFVIEGEGQYLVMDFVEGPDLRQILERHGPVEVDVALPWFLEIADALAYLHTRNPRIVHRDVKPGNIKIGLDDKAILVDFGLAKVVEESVTTATGAKAMTPGFSPPEQYGAGRTDPRTDIYSFGATLYTALTAAIPEDALERAMGRARLTPIRNRNPDVGVSLAQAIEKGLALEPDERFQTFVEFAEALNKATLSAPTTAVRRPLPYLEKTVVAAKKTLMPGRPTRLLPRRQALDGRLPNWLLAAAVLALAGGVVAILPAIGAGLRSLLPDYLLTSSGGASTIEPTSTPQAEARSNETRPVALEASQTPAGAATQVDSEGPIATPASVLATPTPQAGGAGQIAFASDRAGPPQIFLMNVDGTGLIQITDLAEGACQPDWSPDGQRIAFSSPCRSSQESYPGSSIWVVRVDGSGLRPLAAAPGGDFDPAWSPGGDQIAFTSLEDGHPQVYAMHADGSGRRNLSQNFAPESQPSWSPSGSQVIYVSRRSGVDEIWVMPSEGGEGRRFSRSAGRDDSSPSWSPDGQLVIFAQEIGGIHRLVAMQFKERAGPEIRICPEGPQAAYPMSEPRWSPDGRWIAFESWPSGTDHNIAVMTSSCTNYAELTTDPALDFDVAWRPIRQSPQ